MAQASNITMALASSSIDIPKARDSNAAMSHFSNPEKQAHALLTPPNSISPNMPAHGVHRGVASPPLINIEEEINLEDGTLAQGTTPPQEDVVPAGMPLSKGALSGLDASAAITPAMLAKDHLPGIMLGNGPRPIRHVIGELNHSVPGFSRIPPAKARRLVVAALENRHGGGPDGSVTFSKIGWGRWDAHVKTSKDSAIGSFNETRYSPPRSEHSSYAVSHQDSALGMSAPAHMRRDHSGGSWANSASLREEDELEDMEMDMDVPENEADKMSLDEDLPSDDDQDFDSATDDEDWAARGPAALRKASLPTPGMPRRDYQSLSVPLSTRFPMSSSYSHRSWSRRPSGRSERGVLGTSLPRNKPNPLDPACQTPEEKAAVEALMQLGSM